MPFISNLAKFSGRKPCFQPTPRDEHQASWMKSQHLCRTYVLRQLTGRAILPPLSDPAVLVRGPRNLNAKTNKKGKSIVGDEEDFEDINEGEKLSIDDEDDLIDVDLGDDDDDEI
ncbi:hypothetical protein LR48_Vigan10g195500 [Vigna angularis]|uniref:Uncharacterized protein n=1 Tax=Phaseolus angularis TaxID=3914 RepID=A0A0L9VM70_PHAAN|nr:hypothetical protein LR48_Vigan10g195500 [Vigna angularis]